MEIKRISPEEAKQLLDSSSDHIYLDVRTVPEFDAGHVPSAKNIPVMEPGPTGMMQINPRFVEIVEAKFGKGAKYITGCKMGGRSMKAAELLLQAGFTEVTDMRGGYGGEIDPMGQLTYPGWEPRGFPTSRESEPEARYESLSKKT